MRGISSQILQQYSDQISFMHCIVCLAILHLDDLCCALRRRCVSDSWLAKDDIFCRLDSCLAHLAKDKASHGPLLLAVSLCRDALGMDQATQLAEVAVYQLHVFQYLRQTMSDRRFNESGSAVAAAVSGTLYNLLALLLHWIHPDSLGVDGRVHVVELLSNCLQHVLQEPNKSLEPVGIVAEQLSVDFPADLSLLRLWPALGAGCDSSRLHLVASYLVELNHFAEPADAIPSHVLEALRHNDIPVWRLKENRWPYGRGTHFCLPAGSLGVLQGNLMRWEIANSRHDNLQAPLWAVLLSEMQAAGHSVERCTNSARFSVILPRLEAVCQFAESWLRADLYLSENSQLALLVIDLLLTSSLPLLHSSPLLTAALHLVSATLQHASAAMASQLVARLCQSDLLPMVAARSSLGSSSVLSESLLCRALTGREMVCGRFPLLLNYLDFAVALAAFIGRYSADEARVENDAQTDIGVHRVEEHLQLVLGAVIFVSLQVLPHFQEWRFADSFESVDIGSILLHFVTLFLCVCETGHELWSDGQFVALLPTLALSL